MRASPREVVWIVVDHMGPERPRDPSARAVEERRSIRDEQRTLRQDTIQFLPERVLWENVTLEIVARDNAPAEQPVHDPERVPERTGTAEIRRRIREAARLAGIRPRTE